LGKVRPERVKKIARQLLSRFPNKFTSNFETNKKEVRTLITVSSPKLRNRIAGYITRLKSGTEAVESDKIETAEAE
jgi:small subunit ribosomal protein S17e